MQKIIWLPFSSALVLILSGCADNGSTRNDPLGTGPFDSQGNYHEEWANNPSKWTKPGKRSPQPSGDELPLIAKNDQPPPNATPLVPGGGSYSKTPPRVDSVQEPAHHSQELRIVSVKPRSTGTKTGTKSKATASRSKSRTHVADTTTSTKPKTHVTESTTTKPKVHVADTTTSTKPKTHVTESTTTKPKTHVADTTTTKSKSSGTGSGSGTKTKTKSGNYTVKKGDSLELIARHSGTSISAIKKANGMSGELIHPGQSLVVPK